ncbi:MAG: hydroxymethylbilane synthase [Alphaproteobacteria bacterium]
MAPTPALRIGTRASPLALAQAHEVRDRLVAAHPDLAAEGAIEILPLSTRGDRLTDGPLADLGGKGLFTFEIEDGLSAGRLDIAVHSMKDMATVLPDGLAVPCLLEREDPRDVLVGDVAAGLDDLPRGAVVGTASLRRQAQLLHRRPDLRVVPLRGNVGTRLRKIGDGEAAATLLALAGLKRLGKTAAAAAILSLEDMLPAVAQGAIGIECRADDKRVRDLLAPLDHPPTRLCITAERALLAALDGSCRTPIAGHATLGPGDEIYLRALIARPDGSVLHRAERRGPAVDGAALGADLGAELRAADPALFAEVVAP